LVKCISYTNSLSTTSMTSIQEVPTWDDLRQLCFPENNDPRHVSSHPTTTRDTPWTIDCALTNNFSTNVEDIHNDIKNKNDLPILYRERNGWCIYSARLWLALEIKGIHYNTVLMEAKGDTYDGTSFSDISGDGRPEFLQDFCLPQFQFSADDVAKTRNEHLHSGASHKSSIELLKLLDTAYPDTPRLWPPSVQEEGNFPKPASCVTCDVTTIVDAFEKTMPIARESPRAAWLFENEEGFRLDALPRETFEGVLDTVEKLLTMHNNNSGCTGGPFFCGKSISAADVVWAPLLERYAAQLPCLHLDLYPRAGNNDNVQSKWPNLQRWYEAMDQNPSYTCRLKGDAQSWRKVLYVEPWWPSADVWHHRDTVGPKGELCASEEDCINAFGGDSACGCISKDQWADYAKERPWIAESPGKQASATVVQNYQAIIKDALRWIGDEGYQTCSPEDLDLALRGVIWVLFWDMNYCDEETALLQLPGVNTILAYLDHRLCIPRDMGAPAAFTIRKLAKRCVNRQ